MDESLDISGIPQLLIFVRATSRELDVTEDVLDMIPLQKGTKGEDIKLTAVDVLKKFEVAPEKITSIKTDGAPAMLVLHSSVRSGKYKLFSHVQSILEKNPDAVVNQEVFCEVMNELSENNAGRFQDFKKCEKLFLLVNIPFLLEVDEVEDIFSGMPDSTDLLMEFVELKSCDELQRGFRQNNRDYFWKLMSHLPHIAKLARWFILMFPSTYRCEASFFALAQIKNNRRNRLSLQHTKESL
ncbi:UNVERIFIED_CONTAM: hypothetical protein FKN15_036875 [Acipenser sinensis]